MALEFQNGGRLDLCEWKVDGDTAKGNYMDLPCVRDAKVLA